MQTQTGDGHTLWPGRHLLHASSNSYLFFSNIGSTAIEEMHSPYSKQGKQKEYWYSVETTLEYPTTSSSLIKNETKWLHEGASKRWFSETKSLPEHVKLLAKGGSIK